MRVQDKTYAPFIGMTDSTRCGSDSSFYSMVDTVVDWFYRPSYFDSRVKETQNRQPIPILDRDRRTIAGVCVRDFHQPITDPMLQDEIESAIKKMSFNTKYVRVPTTEWLQSKDLLGIARSKMLLYSLILSSYHCN